MPLVNCVAVLFRLPCWVMPESRLTLKPASSFYARAIMTRPLDGSSTPIRCAAVTADSQALNLYTYTGNNPVNRVIRLARNIFHSVITWT